MLPLMLSSHSLSLSLPFQKRKQMHRYKKVGEK